MARHLARRTLALALSLAAAGVALPTGTATASTTCAKWAATTGNDAAAGTETQPFRSLGRLTAALQPGETGCLPAGKTFYAVEGNGVIGAGAGTATAPVRITSGPGGRATIKGQLWIKPVAHDLELTGLDFRGGYRPDGTPLYTKSTHLIVHGDRIGIVGNDISDPRGICIGAGRAHESEPTPNEVAEDLRVTGNRIHGCGMASDIVFERSESGAHGVYLENTLRARITDNLN